MSVYQINNIWRYRFTIRGRRYFRALPECRTEKEARRKEDDAKYLARRGKLDTKDQTTKFIAFARDEWLPWSKENHKTKHYLRHQALLRDVFTDFFGQLVFAQISSLTIEKFKTLRRKTLMRWKKDAAGNWLMRPRSSASVNRDLAAASSIFTLAMKAGIIERNPCALVESLVEDNERERVLEDHEEPVLFETLSARIDEQPRRRGYLLPMIILYLNTGLRLDELLKLRRDEVDFTAGEIRKETSKNKRRRKVRMNSTVRELLTGILSGHEHDYVFVNPRTGRPYNSIRKGWKALLAAAGIEGLRIHDLRHTFASRLVEAGVHQVEVKELLGHRSTRMTDRYTHGQDARKQQAVDSLAGRQWHKSATAEPADDEPAAVNH